MGFVIFGVLALYLIISIIVVIVTVRGAKKRGKSLWLWGLGTALVMCLIPFWDWAPTVVAHKYYCSTEAGFWEYKSPEQWKMENPGVMETLVANNTSPKGVSPNWIMEHWSGMEIASINQRFGIVYKNHLSKAEEGELFLNVWRWQSELVDKKNGEILARQVDFSTGNGCIGGADTPLKFWLQNWHCPNSKINSNNFSKFINSFEGCEK